MKATKNIVLYYKNIKREFSSKLTSVVKKNCHLPEYILKMMDGSDGQTNCKLRISICFYNLGRLVEASLTLTRWRGSEYFFSFVFLFYNIYTFITLLILNHREIFVRYIRISVTNQANLTIINRSNQYIIVIGLL